MPWVQIPPGALFFSGIVMNTKAARSMVGLLSGFAVLALTSEAPGQTDEARIRALTRAICWSGGDSLPEKRVCPHGLVTRVIQCGETFQATCGGVSDYGSYVRLDVDGNVVSVCGGISSATDLCAPPFVVGGIPCEQRNLCLAGRVLLESFDVSREDAVFSQERVTIAPDGTARYTRSETRSAAGRIDFPIVKEVKRQLRAEELEQLQSALLDHPPEASECSSGPPTPIHYSIVVSFDGWERRIDANVPPLDIQSSACRPYVDKVRTTLNSVLGVSSE